MLKNAQNSPEEEEESSKSNQGEEEVAQEANKVALLLAL